MLKTKKTIVVAATTLIAVVALVLLWRHYEYYIRYLFYGTRNPAQYERMAQGHATYWKSRQRYLVTAGIPEPEPGSGLTLHLWVDYVLALKVNLVVLHREGETWTGTRFVFDKKTADWESEPLAPVNGWGRVSRAIEAGKVLTLADSATLKDDAVWVVDGALFALDVASESQRNRFIYHSPSYHKWPEARRFHRLISKLESEFAIDLAKFEGRTETDGNTHE